jgi:selenocysteine lyase/cysteine desulfurase
MPDTDPDTQIIRHQRHLLDISEDVAHLNCAYMAPNLKAATLGFAAEPENRRIGHYQGLTREEPLPGNLLETLAAANVFVSAGGTPIRVTPHVYTSGKDIERFFTALETSL